MCSPLFQSGETVKLANGNPICGTVIHDDEPWQSVHMLDNAVLVTWEEAVPSEHGYLVVCEYYNPEKLIHA